MTSLIPERVRRAVREFARDRTALDRTEVVILKAGDGRGDLDRLVASLAAPSTPKWQRTARRIERDKARVTRSLGDRPTDPSPLPATRYATEAAALEGCATPRVGGRLLYALVRTLTPAHAIEIGTAHGYGALYIGCALRDNGTGRLLTLEGMTVRAALSQAAISRFGLEQYVEVVPGFFEATLPAALDRARPLDLLFSDGDKDPALTRRQFELALECMDGGGHMFFDDINFDPEIAALWRDLVGHRRVTGCATFLGRWGLLQVAPASQRS